MLDVTNAPALRLMTPTPQAAGGRQGSPGTARGRAAWIARLHRLRRLGSPLLILTLWQLVAWSGLVSPQTLASPLQILMTARTLTLDGTLPHNLLVSLLRAGSGFVLAVAGGVTLALLAGLSRLGEDIIDAPMQMLRTLPALALVPLFILWFGIGETPKVGLVALGALFPIYLNLFKGLRTVDPKLLEMSRTLGLSPLQTIRHVLLPGALPDLLVGLRYAVGISWLMLVVAEQVNASSGIGHMMMDAQDFLRTDIILLGLVIYAGFGLLSDQAVRLLERVLLAWRPSQRGLGSRP